MHSHQTISLSPILSLDDKTKTTFERKKLLRNHFREYVNVLSVFFARSIYGDSI